MANVTYEKYIGDSYIEETIELDPEHCKINTTDIVKDMSNQPMLVSYYGEIYAILRAELSRKEENLKKVYSMVAGMKRLSTTKPTENKIEEETINSKEYTDALLSLQKTRFNFLKIDSWFKAIQSKKDLLVAISYRQNAELKAL